MSEKLLRRLIRESLIAERPLEIKAGAAGTASVDVGGGIDVDMAVEADNAMKSNDVQHLQDILVFNELMYSLVTEGGNKSAWQSIGEHMLSAWGYTPEEQGSAGSGEGSTGDDGGAVSTFYDVIKGDTYYSVKASYKALRNSGDYHAAATSSNVKMQSILKFVLDKGDIKLGNIGSIINGPIESPTVQWGHITEPISAREILGNVQKLLEKQLVELGREWKKMISGGKKAATPAQEKHISDQLERIFDVYGRFITASAGLTPGPSGEIKTLNAELGLGTIERDAGDIDQLLDSLKIELAKAGGATKSWDGRLYTRGGEYKLLKTYLGDITAGAKGTHIGSIKLTEPEKLFNATLASLAASNSDRADVEISQEDIEFRKKFALTMKSMSKGLKKAEMQELIANALETIGLPSGDSANDDASANDNAEERLAAGHKRKFSKLTQRYINEYSMLKSLVKKTILKEDLTKSDKKEIEKIARKQFERQLTTPSFKKSVEKIVSEAIKGEFKGKDHEKAVVEISKKVLRAFHSMLYQKRNIIDTMSV